jgi:hypothetical protein
MESLELINRPVISKRIAASYAVVVVFIAVLIVIFAYLAFSVAPFELVFASIVLVPIEAVMLSLLTSFHRTEYILTREELVIKTSRLIALTKERRVPLAKVKSVERTLIPFGLRLFGASFYGGYYYIPGLGRAFVTMTNFNDGVLLRTEDGNYIITPRNPEEFMKAIRARCKK